MEQVVNSSDHAKSPYKENLRRWLVDPVGGQSPTTKLQIHLFSATSLGLIFIGILLVFFNVLVPQFILINRIIHIEILIALGWISIAYAIGRFGYYTIAVWLLIGVCSIAILVMGVARQPFDAIHPFSFLLIPILLAGILHSPLAMILVSGANLIAIFLLPTFVTTVAFEDITSVAIELLIMTLFVFVPLVFLKNHWIATATVDEALTIPFAEIVDSLPDMIAIHIRGKYVYINPAGVQLLKANSVDDVLYKPIHQFLHPEYHRNVPAQLVRLEKNDQIAFKTTEKFLSVDGEVIDVEVFATQITYHDDLATQISVKPLSTPHDIGLLLPDLDIINRNFQSVAQKYEHLLRTTSDIIIVCNEYGLITAINMTGQQILGYAPQDLEKRPLDSLVAPLRLGEFRNLLQHYATHETNEVQLETEFITKSGQIVPFEVNISAITLPNQNREQVYIIRDITERHVAQMVIQQAEERFANIFQNSLVGISITSFDKGVIIDVNETFLQLFGYTRNEIIGATIFDYQLWTPEENKSNQRQLLEHGLVQQIIKDVPDKSGKSLTVVCSLQIINLGGESCILTLTQDITEQHRAEKSLRNSENRYRAISELISDFAYGLRVSENGVVDVEWITDSVTRMTGYSIEEVIVWETWKKMFHPDDFPILIQRLKNLINGIPTTFEARVFTKNGELIWLRDHAHPIWDDEHKRVVGIIAASQNITEQQLAEISLKTHALQHAVIAELGQLALEAKTTPQALFQEAVMLTGQVLNVNYCKFLEYDPHQNGLVFRAGIGWEDELSGQLLLDLSNNDAHAVYSFTKREPVIIESLPDDPRFSTSKLLVERQIMSGMSVVIPGHEYSVGVLAVHSTQKREFSIDDMNFLQSVANVFSAYIGQRQMRKAERDQRAFAEAISETAAILNSTLELDNVLPSLLDSLKDVVTHDASSIMIIENGIASLMKHRGFEKYNVRPEVLEEIKFPLVEGHALRKVIASGKPFIRSDVHQDPDWVFPENTEWIHGNIAVPIMFGNELLGVISVDSEKPDAFNEEDARRLSAFANHASIAIRNARRATELTEQVAQRTAALDFEHRKLESILDASGEGILLVEGDTISYVNQALCGLTGYIADELISQRVDLLIEGNDSTLLPDWSAIQGALFNEGIWRHEHRIRRKDTTYFDAGLTVSLANHSESLHHIVAIIRDISQERELDAQKARFIANASHELRSPIASLNTRLFMLRNQPEKSEYHLEMLERIVKRTNNLVGKLLDLSRFEHGVIVLNRQEVIFQTLVKDVYEQLLPDANLKGITIDYQTVEYPLRIFADPDRIMQVIVNVVNNAINYTPAGGNINLEVTIHHDVNTPEDQMAVVCVQDTGIGISPENLDSIFQPFSRATNDNVGTGLGLSITKEIMTLHGGDIMVKSELGKGSTFSIHLPLLPTPNTDE